VERIDRARAERAVREFLIALGRDPDGDPELQGTPARVVEAYAEELLGGYAVDVQALLSQSEGVAEGKLSGLIALRGVSLSTVCPHHLLLSHGSASVVYRPGPRLFGLGTLAALVGVYARRLSLQTFAGAARLAEHSGDDAAVLRERVTSKGGTTERALNSMDGNELKRKFVEAVKQAAERSRELGEQLGKA